MADLTANPSLLQAALDPLESASRSDVITRRLQQAIALGLLADGSPLPSEAELASQMRVSTVTLRTSLAELRRQGLIVTRRGRSGGSFIKSPVDHDHEPLRQQLLAMNIDDIRDIRDLHVAIAGTSASLAAKRARGRTVQRLEQCAAILGSASSASEAVKADFRFHAELAASTRSAQLTRVEMAIMTELTPLMWISGAEVQTIEQGCAEHQAIVEAIAGQDPVAARSRTEQHIENTLNGLIELRMRLGREES
jgi:DNA-binding FadR family transcriptional regulator